MAEIRFRGTVPVPREQVFDLLTNARRWPEFSPGVEAVDHVEGWDAPGGRCRLTLRVLGRRRTFDCELIDIQRPQMFRYLAREQGQPTAVNEGQFAEVAEGTRVEITARRDPRRGVAGLLDRMVVPWALKRTLDRSIAALTITLTGRGRGAGST